MHDAFPFFKQVIFYMESLFRWGEAMESAPDFEFHFDLPRPVAARDAVKWSPEFWRWDGFIECDYYTIYSYPYGNGLA